MLISFLAFTFAGIGLCIKKHWVWGVVCFFLALAIPFILIQ
jgi:hypothetical protein